MGRANASAKQERRRDVVIGINADFRQASGFGGGGISHLPSGYYDRLMEAGALPIVLPPIVDGNAIGRLLDHVDGLLLIGGGDYDPNSDGYERTEWTRLVAARRDTFDRLLIRHAAARRLPTLAIGAGAQLLNLACGGTLHYHLPVDVRKAMPHVEPNNEPVRHGLRVSPGSFVSRVWADCSETMCVSRHHQAIDGVAHGFRVSARGPDGVIEAIESTDPDWLAIGVQWHPESPAATAIDSLLFGEWVGEARAMLESEHPHDVGAARVESLLSGRELKLSREAAAKWLGVSRNTLASWAAAHRGPPYTMDGNGSVYSLAKLQAWSRSQREAVA